MWYFLIGLAILIAGYYTYGRLIEKILAPDDRETPAVRLHDGVDFVVLPQWKNMLIQLLNIAGIGPVIGVILGIRFGVIVFLFIPIGNIIGGAVHDFMSGMMSLRNDGANLPELVRRYLGRRAYYAFNVFMCIVLLLVVAVFINVPAKLIDGLFDGHQIFLLAVVLVFVYYIVATLFPVDKIIGRFYPLFGGLLLLGTLAVFGKLVYDLCGDPSILTESAAFRLGKLDQPILPMLFVTIACGILSGFHATQSPIIARTMRSEREARANFYGMMVVEGLIAMVWAAAALVVYNADPLLLGQNPNTVLIKITEHFLGNYVGVVTLVSVIVLAVTSGDTAMRSLRLSLAESLKVSQTAISKRLLLCVPLILLVSLLLWWSNQDADSFGILWNYFAWGNQVLAAVTLTAATVYLVRAGKPFIVTLVPGVFMSFIVWCFILWTSREHRGPAGLGLPLDIAQALALILAVGTFGHLLSRELRGLNRADANNENPADNAAATKEK